MGLRRDPDKVKAWRARSRPLLSRKGLEPGGAIKRKKSVAPINRKRMKRLREEQFAISSGYRAWVIEQPCAACGSYHPDVGSQPARVGKTRGAGAKAEWVLSLCAECHRWETEDRPGFNEAFHAAKGVWPWEMAFYRFEMFHRDTTGENPREL